jgi:hypothetical protein
MTTIEKGKSEALSRVITVGKVKSCPLLRPTKGDQQKGGLLWQMPTIEKRNVGLCGG